MSDGKGKACQSQTWGNVVAGTQTSKHQEQGGVAWLE